MIPNLRQRGGDSEAMLDKIFSYCGEFVTKIRTVCVISQQFLNPILIFSNHDWTIKKRFEKIPWFSFLKRIR